MTPASPHADRNSDEELVAAFVAGSEPAFTALVGRYKDRLFNFTVRMLGDREASLDVVQETFIRLHAKAHTYRPVARFSTWIYTIAANLARSELRRRRWSLSPGGRSASAEPPDPSPGPDRRAETAITAEAVRAALDGIPAAFREVAVLFYIEDMEYEDISRVLGIRLGTVKSRLNRARAALARALGPLMEDDAGL